MADEPSASEKGERPEPALVATPTPGATPAAGTEMAGKRKKPKRGGKRRGRLASAARMAGLALVAAFAGSLLWAGVYRFAPPPGTLVMLERKLGGDVIVHPWTPLEDISPHLVDAVIAAEDTRFCLHNGIDFEAIGKAVEDNRSRARSRGASTITQQTAKNAFLWNGGGWARKGAEAWFALVIDAMWPKRRVMEVYLNVAEWGDGLFGAEAAAQARFGKSARDLTARESALLAAVLPSPNKWRVDPPGPYVQSRAATLRMRMNQVRRDGLAACVAPGG